MHMKPVDRMQKNGRLMVGSMARDTAQTKRAVDGVLDLIHAAADAAAGHSRATASAVRGSASARCSTRPMESIPCRASCSCPWPT